MNRIRIFISSVQNEFKRERAALRDFLRDDPLMRLFFDVFLFENVPALDRRPDALYLDEVEQSDIYVGLFGNDYGFEDREGISPTEREFDQATDSGIHRLIFVKGTDDNTRHLKMQALIQKAQAGLIRKRFNKPEELVTALYAALVEYLNSRDLIRSEPFDAAPCLKASLDDLDAEQMTRFIRIARGARSFSLPEEASPEELLGHLNLLNSGRPTNAAVLAFGKAPQQFLISSGVKCAHFHGTEVAKPIPSYQVYSGTAFQLVDQAVDFVLSKINRWVGTRAEPEPEFTDSGGFKITIWRAKPPEQIKVQPESLPRDLESRVINLLADGAMSRSELSKKLGQKEVSGQLKKVFRDLLVDGMIEYTLPDKRRSPRQQYRLTEKGRIALASLKSEKSD